MRRKILLVEDDPKIRGTVELYLQREGYEVSTADDGVRALEVAAEVKPHLVVLDLMLPRLDGLEVCRALRASGDAAIIMMTARSTEEDKLTGLDLGADDYVTKPFELPELVARARAAVRRASAIPDDPVLTRGDLEIDPAAFAARKNGEEINLTATEFKLLLELARRPGQVFTRELLLERVWNYEYLGDSRLVDVAVQRLRAKVEDDPKEPKHLKTVRGVGYRFDVG